MSAAPPGPELVLCAVSEPMAAAWADVADSALGLLVHHGSTLDAAVLAAAQAVVSPANSFGWMRGGIDAVYLRAFPDVEARVRSAVLATHGGELPVGAALLVPTGAAAPRWLICAPTMREPSTVLPPDTVHPYLAARAVLLLWRDGLLDDGTPVRDAVHSIALPGLGTGVGTVPPQVCARQVRAAWDELFG